MKLNRTRPFTWLSAAIAFAGGCAHEVYSPPARFAPLATPATVAEGQHAAALEVGSYGALFGPDLVTVNGRLRARLAQKLEIHGEVGLAHLERDNDVDTHPNIYAAHSGLKWQPFEHLALEGGLGGGGSAAGAFVSPDLGVILAYENRYVVPFVSLRGMLSSPFVASAIRIGETDGDDPADPSQPILDTPHFTYGAALGAGIRVPLGWSNEPRGSALVGVACTDLADRDGDQNYCGLSAGLETMF